MFPSYNEEENLVKLLPDLCAFLEGEIKEYTIILIDDGSIDSTAKIKEMLDKTLPIRIVSHDKNKGIGQVFRTGFSEINRLSNENDSMMILEADGTSDYKLMPEMHNKLNAGSDIVIASRYVKGGAYKNFPRKRHLISLIGNMILGLAFPHGKIKDYTIFYRGYRMDLIKKALSTFGNKFITSGTFLANTEVLLNLTKLTNKITEVPFIYSYDLKIGKSKMPLLKTLLDYLKFLFFNCFRKLP